MWRLIQHQIRYGLNNSLVGEGRIILIGLHIYFNLEKSLDESSGKVVQGTEDY